jgi:hypothetical protein
VERETVFYCGRDLGALQDRFRIATARPQWRGTPFVVAKMKKNNRQDT